MRRRIGALLTSLLLAHLSMACVHNNHSDEFKGESYATLKQEQLANPDAGQETEPIDGVASPTADHVSVNYHERQQVQYQDEGRAPLLDSVSQD